MQKKIVTFSLFIFIAGASHAWASGHGPVFGFATPTNSKGEWAFDFGASLRRTAGNELTIRSMASYGFTPHLQFSLSVPGMPLTTHLSPSRNMAGDLEGTLAWRFHRNAFKAGTRFESTVFTGLVVPGLQKTPGVLGQLRRAPGAHVGIASGLASRSQYAWLGGGYTHFATSSGDRRPPVFNYSLVYGYRPPYLRKDYPYWDWRLFVEMTGEKWGAVRQFGSTLPGSAGHQVFLGPSTLGIYKNYAISGGVQFPVYRGTSSVFPREKYRVAINFSYFLFRFKGDHHP